MLLRIVHYQKVENMKLNKKYYKYAARITVLVLTFFCVFFIRKILEQEETKNPFIRCSLQGGSIVYGNGKTIVNIGSIDSKDMLLELAKKCYIFEDGLTSDISKPGMSCTEQLGLPEEAYIERVMQYNDEVIYIIKQKSRSLNYIWNHRAIIQNLTQGDYKTVPLDNESIIDDEEVDTSFWIVGNKMFYGTYVYPMSKETRGYRIDTLDLDTYEKETICSFEDLTHIVDNVDISIDQFVIREDGAIALCISYCEEDNYKHMIYTYKNSKLTQISEPGDTCTLVDYDERGVYYVYSNREEKDSKFVVSGDTGKEKVLLNRANVLPQGIEKESMTFDRFLIFDTYYVYIEEREFLQIYDFDGRLLSEVKLNDWSLLGEWVVANRVEYYEGNLWNIALQRDESIAVQKIKIDGAKTKELITVYGEEEKKVSQYNSIYEFPYASMEYVDQEAFEVLKEAYKKVDFYGDFHVDFQEDKEIIADDYIEKFYHLLNEEVTFTEKNTGAEYYLSEYGDLKEDAEAGTFNYQFYDYIFFDIDEDEEPELCIRDGGRFLYVFKYQVDVEKFILWYEQNDSWVELNGSKKIRCDSSGNVYNQSRTDFYQLNEQGNIEYAVLSFRQMEYRRFTDEYETIYMVSLPQYREGEESDFMKAQGYYDKEKSTFYYCVTNEQWEELFRTYMEAEEKAIEDIKQVTFTYEELFGTYEKQVQENDEESMMFENYAKLPLIEEDVYQYIKDAYEDLNFFGVFKEGGKELYATYTDKYKQVVDGKEYFYDGYEQKTFDIYETDYVIESKEEVLKRKDIACFWMFDVDEDGAPELCISTDTYPLAVLKYIPKEDRVILWDTLSMYSQLIGGKKMISYGGGIFTLNQFWWLNESMQVDHLVQFFETYDKSKPDNFLYEKVYMVSLPLYLNDPERIRVTKEMKAVSYYNKDYNMYYFRVTQRQYNELTSNYFRAADVSKRQLERLGCSYSEMFGE